MVPSSAARTPTTAHGAAPRALVPDNLAPPPGAAALLPPVASWIAQNNQAESWLGYDANRAGDVNGDGYDDVLVTAHRYDNGQEDEGVALVFHGSPSGLAAAPAWKVEGNQIRALLGVSAAAAGDVNGDGYDDVIIGSNLYDNGQVDEGAAFLFLGSPSGLKLCSDWRAEGDQAGAHFGVPVSGAGDLNGDGFDEVIAAAVDYDNPEVDEGRVFVYRGVTSGLTPWAVWTAEGDQAAGGFGSAIGPAGDVNADGYGDLVVGVPLYDDALGDQGEVAVYYGSAAGLQATPSWEAEGDQADAYFGYSVNGAGDVNGDGYDDLLVGANLYDVGQGNEGKAWLYAGSSSGLAALPSWSAQSTQSAAFFGSWVSTAGDVDGDGYDDVLISAPGWHNGQESEGRVSLYLGSAAGPSTTPAWSVESDQATAHFGYRIDTAGDVNGDGLSDIIVGSWKYDNPELNEGVAFVYYSAAQAAPAGAVPDGTDRPGVPLDLAAGPGGDLTLAWGSSCSAGDADYAVYEGVLGDFASHSARLCSTGGATTATFVPAAGDAYYLVVPRNAAREGSHGLRSDGGERLPGPTTCAPQAVGSCQ